MGILSRSKADRNQPLEMLNGCSISVFLLYKIMTRLVWRDEVLIWHGQKKVIFLLLSTKFYMLTPCLSHICFIFFFAVSSRTVKFIFIVVGWSDLGQLPDAHPAACSVLSLMEQGEKIRWKSSWVKIKTGKSLTNYCQTKQTWLGRNWFNLSPIANRVGWTSLLMI